MKTIILYAIAVSLLLSCNTKQNHTPNQAPLQASESHQDQNIANIELNNGQKWTVNEEMKPYIAKGEELVTSYIQNKKTDYSELANLVREQNSKLIKSCTMQGKGHDELHKWLLPHLELVDALEEAADAATADEIIRNLQRSNTVYHRYFN